MLKITRLALLVPLICQAQAIEKSIEVILAVKKVHEECIAMAEGQTLTFNYEANAELEFNLHFHHGKDVTYPLNGKYSNYSNTYVATQKNEYCLMWQNKNSVPTKFLTTYRVD
jgi:hypothetical protein